MDPGLTIEDVISRIGEESAFRFFVYTTEEFPLDPRGWDGMAHLALFYGDDLRAEAYAQHAQFLAAGHFYTASAASESSPDYSKYSPSTQSASDRQTNPGLVLAVKVVFGFGLCCCIWQSACSHLLSNPGQVATPASTFRPSTTSPVRPTRSPGQTDPVHNSSDAEPEGQTWDTSILSDNQLRSMNMFDLDLIRNEPFARRGYRFKRTDLRNYFEKQSWYRATTDNQDKIWQELTHEERENINRIKAEQARRKPR